MNENYPSASLRPINWIRPTDACFVEISANGKVFPEDIAVLLTSHSIDIQKVESGDEPPWADDKVKIILKEHSSDQFVLLTPHISTYSLALATIGIESGQDTYFVCPFVDKLKISEIARLNLIGVKIFDPMRFLEECKFALRDPNLSD